MTDQNKLSKLFSRIAKRDSGTATPHFKKLNEIVNDALHIRISEYDCQMMQVIPGIYDDEACYAREQAWAKYFSLQRMVSKADLLMNEIGMRAIYDEKASRSFKLLTKSLTQS